MQFRGEWLLCDDDVIRPIIRARIIAPDGRSHDEIFLIDTGADRTVFRAFLVPTLALRTLPPPPGLRLAGIGGTSAFVAVDAALEFERDDGGWVRVRGRYAVSRNPANTDMSILGRDVLDNFDVIVSKPRNVVLLLSQNHQYRVVRA